MTTSDDTIVTASVTEDNCTDDALPLSKLASAEKRIKELLNLFGRTKTMLDRELAAINQLLLDLPEDEQLEEWRHKVSSWWRQYLAPNPSTPPEHRNTFYNARFPAAVSVSWQQQPFSKRHVWLRLGARGGPQAASSEMSEVTADARGDVSLGKKSSPFNWTSAERRPQTPESTSDDSTYKANKRLKRNYSSGDEDEDDNIYVPENFKKAAIQVAPQTQLMNQSDELAAGANESHKKNGLNGGDGGDNQFVNKNTTSNGHKAAKDDEHDSFCIYCRRSGHLIGDCAIRKDLICYNCFEQGHTSKRCPTYDASAVNNGDNHYSAKSAANSTAVNDKANSDS